MNTAFTLDNQFANKTILEKEIKAILDIKKNKHNVVLNLSGGDFLRAKDLPAIDLSGYVLRDTKFMKVAFINENETLVAKGTDLTSADFTEAVIAGLNITNAEVDHAKFNHAVLQGSCFDGIKGVDAFFDFANLDNSTFKEIALAFACFKSGKLNDTTFTKGNAHGSHFSKASINHLTMIKTIADYSEWCDCKGFRAEFNEVNLSNSCFDGAHLTLSTFVDSNLAGSSFIDGDLIETPFKNCDLTGVDFSGCTITSGDFTGSDMTGAKLGDAIFIKTDLTADCFKGADFTKYKKEVVDEDMIGF